MGLTLIGAGGCADMRRAASLPPVNPESPVAPAVARAVSQNFPRPRLQDVPPAPRNIPAADQVKVEVFGVVRCRSAVRSYARSHPQISHGAAAFATDQQAVALENAGQAPSPGSAALSDDLAARLRAFAAPPSPIAAASPPTPSVRSSSAPVQTAQSAPPPPPLRAVPSAEPAPVSPPAGPDPLLERCS